MVSLPAHYDISTQYLRIIQDETMAVEIFTMSISGFVKKQMDSFVLFLPHFQLLANPPSCITALYAKNTASISTRCLLQIRKTSEVSMPSELAPNVWILTMASCPQ